MIVSRIDLLPNHSTWLRSFTFNAHVPLVNAIYGSHSYTFILKHWNTIVSFCIMRRFTDLQCPDRCNLCLEEVGSWEDVAEFTSKRPTATTSRQQWPRWSAWMTTLCSTATSKEGDWQHQILQEQQPIECFYEWEIGGQEYVATWPKWCRKLGMFQVVARSPAWVLPVAVSTWPRTAKALGSKQ